MMKYKILLLATLFSIFSCEKNEDSNIGKYPECLQITIDNYLIDVSPQTIRANIKKYKYQGEVV